MVTGQYLTVSPFEEKKKENQIKEALTPHFESVARRRNCTLMNGNLNVQVFFDRKTQTSENKTKSD